jgi:succinoglycan biosynthesis transport protein ExoP
MEPHSTTDVSDYVAALKRRKMLLLFIAIPIIALTLTLALGLPDQYVSSALVEFSDPQISGELPSRVRPEKSYADQYVSSLTDAVLSTDHLQTIVKSDKAPESIRNGSGDDIDRIQSNTRVQTVRESVLDPDSGREREIVSAFTISYTSRDPNDAHEMATWLTDAFMQASRAYLQQRARSSAQFYDKESERYREQIAEREATLAEFKAKNFGQLPELTEVNLNVMDRTARDLENTELQLRSLRQDRIFLAQQLEQARTASPDANLLTQLEAEYARKEAIYDDDHPDLLALRRQIENLRRGGPALEGMTLQQQLQAQQTILSQARQRYSADHPDIKRIQRKIDSLQARINAGERADPTVPANATVVQVRAQLNGVDTQIAALQARGIELRGKLTQLEKRVEATPQVEREYQTLTRDLQLARTKYDELLKARMDSELTEAAIAGGRSDELRLVQPPGTPLSPAKPKRIAITMIGLVLALVLALAVAVGAEGVDQTVRGSRDVRRLLSVAPLAVIPMIEDAVSMRRRRLQLAMLAGCTVIGSAIVVMTMRSLS